MFDTPSKQCTICPRRDQLRTCRALIGHTKGHAGRNARRATLSGRVAPIQRHVVYQPNQPVAELLRWAKTMNTRIIIALFTIFGLFGCASTSRTQVSVVAPPSDAYTATIKALVINGFQITHTDRDALLVAGNRPLRNLGTNREAGRMIRITVLVERSKDGAVLHVTWTPPEGSFGTFKAEQSEFVQALSRSMPGVKLDSDYP